ncbi:MAG: helix-turn-helix domain-containing protein [Candidatus Sericytochromatia bacterium]|uniref:Helix-turn-helix domain-containing protein n=1 Tax=Candidatus Tanganyikabacteria bacterium TaxID=2961651 RepID=A0A937X594_9BACT|nr:helix-turn-helix domain-containing protein [Candidatus Tanganyikabacteria bacterium]
MGDTSVNGSNPLKAAREWSGKSRADAADALGVSERTIIRWEQADPNERSVQELEALAALYRLAVAHLLGRKALPTRKGSRTAPLPTADAGGAA